MAPALVLIVPLATALAAAPLQTRGPPPPSAATQQEESETPADALAAPPLPARWTLLEGLVRHTFTHFHLELSVARATATTDRLAKLLPGSAWCTLDLLDDRALPAVMRKVIEKASLS